jgi:hypothetical protein
MPSTHIKLRGSAEAVLGRDSFVLNGAGAYTAGAIVQEIAASDPALRRELLTAAGNPRNAVKMLVDKRVPGWDEIIDGGDIRLISTLPCDG